PLYGSGTTTPACYTAGRSQHNKQTSPPPLWGCVETALSVATAGRARPVPYRTRKLSSPAPMVLHPVGCGRVGHRRHTNPRWWPTRSDPGGPHPHYRVRFVQALPVFRCGFACSNRTAGFLAANSSVNRALPWTIDSAMCVLQYQVVAFAVQFAASENPLGPLRAPLEAMRGTSLPGVVAKCPCSHPIGGDGGF